MRIRRGKVDKKQNDADRCKSSKLHQGSPNPHTVTVFFFSLESGFPRFFCQNGVPGSDCTSAAPSDTNFLHRLRRAEDLFTFLVL